MEKKVIITGINGFVGHHLARELSSNGATVSGVSYEEELSDSLVEIVGEYFPADLVSEWPDTGEVDSVIHLAGFAAVGPSFDAPQKYINGNSAMVTNLCEYYLKQEKRPRIVVVSSGAIYNPNQEMPIDESGDIGFSSPYAVSKILTENQCEYYRNRGLDCVVVRPFNHIGPGQLPGFIVPDLYEKISVAEQGATIAVGNLETKRDYTDVRDVVRAYGKLALAETLEHSLYNICSGGSVAGTEVFELMKEATDRKDVSFAIDPSLVRPTDIAEIIGDSGRIQNELGWKPEISIIQSIRDFANLKK